MDFITKKQYEDACNVIQKAIDNKQIVHNDVGYRENENIPMESIAFLSSNEYPYRHNQLTFLSPDIAIKQTLHELRNKLKSKKEAFYSNQKELEELEIKERKLVSALALIKE